MARAGHLRLVTARGRSGSVGLARRDVRVLGTWVDLAGRRRLGSRVGWRSVPVLRGSTRLVRTLPL